METLLTYLTETGICLAVFYFIYRLLLWRDTFFGINRYFLLSTILFSIMIPVFTVNTTPVEETAYYGTIQTIVITANTIENSVKSELSSWEIIAIIYATGVAIFFIRFLFQMIQLLLIVHKNGINKIDGYKIVFTEDKFAPFSFFNIIFLNRSFNYNSETQQILAHEKIHIKKRHTYDIILMEIVTILQWCNPVIWFYRRSIRDVHEFQADEGVVSNGYDKINYQKLILKQISGADITNNNMFQPANNFNYSTIKRRIVMLTKSRTRKIAILKLLFIIPVSIILVLAFSCSEKDDNLFVMDSDYPVIRPESLPQFPGGWDGQAKFIKENLHIPDAFIKNGIPAKIAVRFEVMKDGSIKNARCAQNLMLGNKKWSKDKIGFGCDEEVLRVVNKMPKWKPAYYKGKPVNYTESIQFFLGSEAMKRKWIEFNDDNDDHLTFKYKDNSHISGYYGSEFQEKCKIMQKYIAENLKYPQKAKDNGVEGTVHITFRIDKNGNISGVKVLQSIGYGCDEEAVRVLKSMPKIFNGNGSSDEFVEMTMPLKFRLSDNKNKSIETNTKVKYEPDHFMELDKMPVMDIETFHKNFKYPEEARKIRVSGTVYVKAKIGVKGNVEKAKVVTSDNEILNESALEMINKGIFKPGEKNGKPVPAWVTIPVVYKLQDKN